MSISSLTASKVNPSSPLHSGAGAPSPARQKSGFTLIEMLVVITIMVLLASLIAPAMSSVLEKTKVIRCQSNQRQLGMALMSYAADYGRYPTNYYPRTEAFSWNWGDECAGKWLGRAPSTARLSDYVPDQSDAFPDIRGIQRSAWHRLAAAGYADYDKNGNPVGVSLCTAKLPSDDFTFTGGANSTSFAMYAYNGPQVFRFTMGNNGNQTGLYLMGRYHQGVVRGVRAGMAPVVKGTNRIGPSTIAILACPTIAPKGGSGTSIMFEPHGNHGSSPTGRQYDVGWGLSREMYKYGRNYLFADLHVRFVNEPTREFVPNDL